MATSIVEYFGPPPKIKIGVKLTKQIKETRTNKLGIFFFIIGHSLAKKPLGDLTPFALPDFFHLGLYRLNSESRYELQEECLVSYEQLKFRVSHKY